MAAANKKDNKILAKKYDQLQLLTKTQANAVFGGMSSPANPYFYYIIGASITAGARECLQMANLTIHQTLGFQGGVAL
jgi:DNA polymerase elongation subunit (family B)